MILCDIGNTHLHFYNGSRVWKNSPNALDTSKLKGDLYYISVSPKNEELLIKAYHPCYNIASLLHLESAYEGLGVDRKAACLGLGLKSGVVIDAGSAISVDVMDQGVHVGGVLLPGFGAYQQAYKSISKVLDHPINVRVPLDHLPKNTAQALSFGALKSVLLVLNEIIGDQKAYFTGGDGKFLASFFPQAIYNELLVFEGMQHAIAQELENLKS
ncbi:type III pantothenate kinase [Helicobacter bizzozeronii]|uniref:type III pantothenate kinase n=1 Tax=Helicobacter bizzozeronii TaxID=56877 RepID=UPI000CEE43BF|nr:type III pantothenate kinase [Helicobacter bizzozeronii]